MSDARPLVRMKLVQIEAMLRALGAAGPGVGELTQSLGPRLPQTLQTDLKQVGYIGQRVMHGGFELDDVDTQRFQLLTGRVVAALEQVQTSAPPTSGSWRPDSPELPAWGYFTEGVMKHYVNFGGRARRREYWMFTLFHILGFVMIGVLPLIGLALSDSERHTFSFLVWLAPVLLLGYFFGTLLPALAISVRRLHDAGYTGWMELLEFAGLRVVILVFHLMDSQPGPNKWGPNPKGVTEPTRAF